jgi:membrane associated rhomboid family serine protease
VAIPSLLQIPFPGLLRALERDPDQIRQHGQWWRLVTSAVVQDGGIAGTVFNLVILAIVGVVAIRAWGSLRGLIIFAVGVVGFNLATTFAWPSVGAGNSAATFTLAASVTGLALVKVRGRVVMLLGALTAACGIVLLALLDAHGSAVLGGLVIGVLVAAISPPGLIPDSAARAGSQQRLRAHAHVAHLHAAQGDVVVDPDPPVPHVLMGRAVRLAQHAAVVLGPHHVLHAAGEGAEHPAHRL